jgi:hypothetical protein
MFRQFGTDMQLQAAVICADTNRAYIQYMVLPSVGNETNELGGRRWYGEQDENGVDLSLIRDNLKLIPAERPRRGDRARRNALRLLEYGRRQREAAEKKKGRERNGDSDVGE